MPGWASLAENLATQSDRKFRRMHGSPLGNTDHFTRGIPVIEEGNDGGIVRSSRGSSFEFAEVARTAFFRFLIPSLFVTLDFGHSKTPHSELSQLSDS